MKRTSLNKLSLLRSLLTASRTSSTQENRRKGFTLIELLVVVIIAGGIISGLLYLVVELLTADQREASRTQTQQEMQMALDYISAELREAVYIYDQECMSASAHGNIGDEDYCPGLYNHIPDKLTPTNNNHPIIAFWKQQILPTSVRDECDAGTADDDVPCVSGHAYALVIYTLDTNEDDDKWDGLARIRRYSLSRFESDGDEVAGYVDPGAYQQVFRSWPFYRSEGEGNPENQQDTDPVNKEGDVLVDFVDDRIRTAANSDVVGTNFAVCPGDPDNNVTTVAADDDDQPYLLASDPGIVTGVANSFYACVSNRQQTGQNRDVLLFLRGNAQGRPAIGVNDDANAFLPTLETRVLSRPVLEKLPFE